MEAHICRADLTVLAAGIPQAKFALRLWNMLQQMRSTCLLPLAIVACLIALIGLVYFCPGVSCAQEETIPPSTRKRNSTSSPSSSSKRSREQSPISRGQCRTASFSPSASEGIGMASPMSFGDESPASSFPPTLLESRPSENSITLLKKAIFSSAGLDAYYDTYASSPSDTKIAIVGTIFSFLYLEFRSCANHYLRHKTVSICNSEIIMPRYSLDEDPDEEDDEESEDEEEGGKKTNFLNSALRKALLLLPEERAKDFLVDLALPLMKIAAKNYFIQLVEGWEWSDASLKQTMLKMLFDPADTTCLSKVVQVLRAFSLIEIWLKEIPLRDNAFISEVLWLGLYKRFWFSTTHTLVRFSGDNAAMYLVQSGDIYDLVPLVIGSGGAYLNDFFLPLIGLAKCGRQLTLAQARQFIQIYSMDCYLETISLSLGSKYDLGLSPIRIRSFEEVWNIAVGENASQTIIFSLYRDRISDVLAPPSTAPGGCLHVALAPANLVGLDKLGEVDIPAALVQALGILMDYDTYGMQRSHSFMSFDMMKTLIDEKNPMSEDVAHVVYPHIIALCDRPDLTTCLDFFDDLTQSIQDWLMRKSS